MAVKTTPTGAENARVSARFHITFASEGAEIYTVVRPPLPRYLTLHGGAYLVHSYPAVTQTFSQAYIVHNEHRLPSGPGEG